jgi:BirA family biotin operon repressor/biotin-[acetyl-CoA-carboxylase] ligase
VIGTRQFHYLEVTSTNDVAWEHIRRGAAEGTVITADFQTQGRGRRGRSWLAPPGTALLWSVILWPQTAASRTFWLTAAAAVATARAIRGVTGLWARLKWPNDVWVDERKVGGLLTETEAQGDVIPRAVVGIGLNLNQTAADFPAELAGPATSLRMAVGRPVDRAAFQEALESEFDAQYALFRQGEDAALLAAWREVDLTCGRPVWVQGAGQTWTGTALHVDETGTLWVRSADGQTCPVAAEEVSIRPFSSWE